MTFKIDTGKFGSMPNQAEGTVHGKPFYFRARHGGWSLRVAPPGGDPVVYGEVVANGEDPSAGWWEEKEARDFLTGLLEKVPK